MDNLTQGGSDTKDIDVGNIEERIDAVNFADNEELISIVRNACSQHIENQESLLEPYFDEIEYYDYMFRCGRNSEKKAEHKPMATPEDAKSDAGASMFFRQVMQSAAKVYSLQNSRDAFFKYTPVATKGVPYSAEDGKMQANQMDTLVNWNLDQIGFEENILMPMDISIPKNGLAFLMINWERKSEAKTFVIPNIDDVTGKVTNTVNQEVELLTKNHADLKLIPPMATRFDPAIDTVQDQECFTVCELIGLDQVINYVRNGYWSEDRFKELVGTHRWDGFSGNLGLDEERDNMEIDDVSNTMTGKFLNWRVWVNLPIDDDGVIDEEKNVPQRFVVDFIGNSVDNAVCMRIERNDDPDDEIPVQVIHDYPDERGKFFHISKGHVLKNNYAVETTTINQMIDNVSLALNPATIERKNSVVKRPGKLGRSARYIVRNSVNEDIREFNIADRTQTSQSLLQYIREDSKMAIHTDPAQMGEGLGARATATEASGVMKLSAAPSVMNAKYITKQAFSWIGKKMSSYWKAYSLPEQVIRITDTSSSIYDLAPSKIYADFDIRVDVVDKIVDDIIEENKISQDLKLVAENQMIGSMVDVRALLDEYFIRRYKKTFTSNDIDFDARDAAHREINLMLNGTPVTPEPNQNHRVHLEIKRAERLRYRGLEQEMPQLQLLDNNIEQHAQMMGGGQSQAPQAPQAPEEPVAPLGGAGDIPADMGSAAQTMAGQ